MGKHNHDNFDIISGEIWKYETRYYSYLLKENKSKKLIAAQEKKLKKIQQLIKPININQGTPFLKQSSDPVGYTMYLNQEKKGLTLTEEIALGWFSEKGALYYYDYNILLDMDTTYLFHYWFALRVNRYNSDIFMLSDFLDYHVEHSFKNQFLEMILYLERLLDQYEFIRPKAIREVEVFVEKLDCMLIDEQRSTNAVSTNIPLVKISKNIPNGIKHSFTLVTLQEDRNYFEKRRGQFLLIYNRLRNSNDTVDKGYIHPQTTFEQFKAIFSGVPIVPENRIRWMADFIELKAVVNYLRHSDRIINTKKNIWNRTVYCFSDQYGNDISRKQLSDANGSQETIARMERLLSDFPQ